MTSVASRIGSGLFSPTDGSRTIVIHDSQPREEGYESDRDSADGRLVGSLRLRGGPRSRPAVSWNEDVVDNEGMGKKKSKICCIYHKPRRFDESSDEDDSSDSDSDNSGHDYSTHNHHNHHHQRHVQHTDNHNSNNLRTTGGESAMTDIIDDSEANTYERPIPNKHSKGKGKA